MVCHYFLKIENFENYRIPKNIFYIFQGLLHFENNFYIFIKNVNLVKIHYNIEINLIFSRQWSNALLFGITRLRLSREQIKNRLYFLVNH